MNDKLAWFTDAEAFRRCRAEINKENRVAISLLAMGGLPIGAAVLVSELVVTGGGAAYSCGFLLIAYFLFLLFFDRKVLPKDYPRATGLLYALEAPMMLLAVLLGTVLDRVNHANTILLFLLILPVFILDYPWRSLLIQGCWSLLFAVLCVAVKAPEIWRADLTHIFVFYIGASVATNVVLRIRIDSLKHLEESNYLLEHDVQTGCLNRQGLQKRVSLYLGRPLTVMLADMDQFMLFNDFYGHRAGEDIMRYFTGVLSGCFGEGNIYHHRGDEFLCVLDGTDEAACRAAMERCREQLQSYKLDGKRLALTCAFGYVYGMARNAKELDEMIQLADIYAHGAKKSGQSGSKGGAFDQQSLRAGIVQSNLNHVRAYQVNSLTGLPDMSFFINRTDALLSSVVDVSRRPVVGIFKLTHMREYNNTFNYSGGDALIAEAARQLVEALEGRYVCHITAAQFGILCYEDEVAQTMDRVNNALKTYKPGFPVYTKAGFAWYTGSESAISLMDKARLAQKSIVDNNSAAYCFYDDQMDAAVHFEQYIISHVDQAVEKGWLKVYYQPIVRTVTGHVCNEEALSRWDDPTYGFLTPNRFIPILEGNDLIYKVSLHVVEQVLRDFKAKAAQGVPIVPVSVNLSRRDLQRRDMVQAIAQRVDASGYARSMIKIEITESAFMEDEELLKREVQRFRDAGFDVWLDDFGSEFSTLNLLQETDFNLIKIDMQFMRNLKVGGKNHIIVSSIIDMARQMGITTLVEGVETWRQYDIMRQLGCEKIQGYLFNHPNPLQYVVDRALNHTGIVFEAPEDTPYYAAIGDIDLDAAMSREDTNLLAATQSATGIVQYRDGAFSGLRMSEHFRNMLERWGVPCKGEDCDVPLALKGSLRDTLVRAIERSAGEQDWINCDFDSPSGLYTLYVRRVAVHRDGSVALLVILLKDRGEKSGLL